MLFRLLASMKVSLPWLLGAILCASYVPKNSPSAPPPPLRPGTLLQTDFEAGTAWSGAAPTAAGTLDIAGSTQASLGLATDGTLSSGPLAVASGKSNLEKLTLAFSLSAGAARPVVVRIESFDQDKNRSGGLETRIHSAAPDFYQRYVLDLNKMKPSGAGKFAPDAPFFSFSFALDVADWQGVKKAEIRLDNVHFVKPAFYVRASGSDRRDGRTEKTAFATPQRALDVAQAGDIVAVMNGTYGPTDEQGGIASFRRNEVDWVSTENNTSRNNCWTTMYGTSGISVNIVSGNRTFEPWAAVKKISDGNGIIIDVNQGSKRPEAERFSGRTLVVNNLVFGNGGSGIHTLKSKCVDIIHNTAYLNSASPELLWGQIFMQRSEDVRLINNLVVARPGEPVNIVSASFDDRQNTGMVRPRNIYFGGDFPALVPAS